MAVSKPMVVGILAVLAAGAGALAYHERGATPAVPQCAAPAIALTIAGSDRHHDFCIERATTAAEQAKGLMFRTDLRPDGGMLFWPYPASGGAPEEATFWMQNTPTSLDIVFIRADGTIARIAENTVPYSEAPIPSGEPVAAVLELVAGRTAALGIREGDRVSWPGRR